MQHHRWRKDGELSTRLGGRPIHEALRRGLECYGGALSAIEVFDVKLDRAEREAKRQAAETQGPSPTGGGRRRRR